MKRFLVISIILHALIIAAAFFLFTQKGPEVKTFIARLVTPEETQKVKEPPRPEKQKKQKIRRQESIRTGETGAPKQLYSLPKGRSASKGRTTGKETGKTTTTTTQAGADRSSANRPKEISLRDKLFDRNIIGKTARENSARTKSVKSGGVSFDIGSGRYYGWVQRVGEKLSAVWRYPRDLAERRIFGDVYVRITFKKNGRLSRTELVRTSGYRSLDDSVIRALNDANPYWPLPDDWGENELTITGHFYVP